ncbi:MAG: hypothetical protein WHX93_10930 [bacterium]
MDKQALKEQIASLDPKTHKALKDALMTEYGRLAGEKGEARAQSKQTPDPFAEIFRKAVDELSRRYMDGTLDYIQKRHPDLYQKTNQAEDRLNEAWKAGLQEKAGIEEFREVLKDWYFLHLQGIEIYSQEQLRQEK